MVWWRQGASYDHLEMQGEERAMGTDRKGGRGKKEWEEWRASERKREKSRNKGAIRAGRLEEYGEIESGTHGGAIELCT